MQLQVNGETIEFSGVTVADLIAQLQLSGRRLAVEVNCEIIPKGEHESLTLSNKDHIEIVHAIGGG